MSRIVVFEDDETIRNLVCQILETEGHEVESYADPGLALDSVDFKTFDLIITDLSMPTPGEEAIRRLRNDGIDVPIIVMSAHLSPTKTAYLKKLGVHQTISKPFKIFDLQEAVAATI